MKKLNLIILLLFYLINQSFAQIGPCSINPGMDIEICNDDTQFTLNGVIGSQVNNLQWTTNDPTIFDIVNPSSEISTVNILMNPAPVGCYIFTMSAECVVNGSTNQISQTLEVCIEPQATQAVITVDGLNLSEHVTCHDVELIGNTNFTSGESGSWRIDFDDSNFTIEIDPLFPNILNVSMGNLKAFPCKKYDFFYEITNGGCTTVDVIEVTFIGQNEEVEFVFPQSGGDHLCGTEIELRGTNVGCQGNEFYFTHLNPQDFNTQPIFGQKGSEWSFTTQDVTFFESGFYTFQYDVISTDGICEGGSAEVTFYVCVTDESEYPENIEMNFCDGMPETYTFTNVMNPDWVYSDWSVNQSGAFITIDGDEVTINNIDPEGQSIRAYQNVITNQCNDGEYECGFERSVILRNGPTVELLQPDFLYLCGFIDSWVAWDYVESTGAGSKCITVLEAPDDITSFEVGRTYCGGLKTFKLNALGEYKFRYSITSGACEDFVDLCVTICDSGQPNAPTVSDLCVNDIVELAGVVPLDNCASILWTQTSGPPITFVNGTNETDQFPQITVAEEGEVCIEFSYSQEEDCYLADITCFNVFPCDSICEVTANIEIGQCSDNGTSTFVSDDYFTAFIDIDNTNGMQWSMKQVFPNGDQEVIYSNSGDSSFGYNFNIQEGDFTLIICIDGLEDCQVYIPIEVPDQCSGCLNVNITNINCYDNGTSTSEDDYWSFDITVEGGIGDWFITSPIYSGGSFGTTTTINMGLIESSEPIEFQVFNLDNRECYVSVSVTPPSPCSEYCDLYATILSTDCHQIDEQSSYTIDLKVSVIGDECFNVIRINEDGTEQSLGVFSGSQNNTFGPFSPMEKFTLIVRICRTDCEREFLVCPPEDCENCLDYVVSNVQCYDNGTENPDDDYWTFDIDANGPSQGWSSGPPFYTSGVYGQTTTVYAGLINVNPSVSFTIYDFLDSNCSAVINVDAPPSCSEECPISVFHKVSKCRFEEGGQVFYIRLVVEVSGDDCFKIIKTNADGTQEILGTFSGSIGIPLGPFNGYDDFSITVENCENPECSREIFIQSPCGEQKYGKSNSREDSIFEISISPNPASSAIKIESNSKEIQMYSIHSYDGKLMDEGNFPAGLLELDVASYPEGIYIFHTINTEGTSISKKFIVID